MTARILDGNALGRELRSRMRGRVEVLAARGVTPGLAVILVGENPASKVYVRNKGRACEELGMHAPLINLPESTSEADLLAEIAKLNADPAIHGILVQLPLPAHIASKKVLEAIAPHKDADGFHPINVGLLASATPRFAPCTPAGVMEMLAAENINPRGKHAVIVGASNIVGKPMAMLLLQKGATITICNSKTPDLGAMTRQADILVVAVGRPKMVTGDMVKPGAVVIDVGINRLVEGPNAGKLAGDVDFDTAKDVASLITPVPGGVGPMTITMLLENTLRAAELTAGLNAV